PTIGVRVWPISTYATEETNDLPASMIDNYHLVLFKACIKALDCEVVEISGDASSFVLNDHNQPDEYPYVRDPVVIFHDKKLVISCEGNKEYGSREILQQLLNYKQLVIDNAYFEGGNVFYVPFI